jgi:SAM-dependent methyltransferase
MGGPGDSSGDLAAWEANADRYAATAGGPADTSAARFRSFLHWSLGDLQGRSVLDLGCGTGWLSAEITEQGGRVTGIDGSERLIELARREHAALEFVLADLTAGLPDLGGRRFDRVVAQMVLMDLAEVDALVADIGHRLLPNGRFIFTIPHPAFFDPGNPDGPAVGQRVPGYLQPEVRWVDTFGGHRHYHRPLGWYVDVLARSGMAVVRAFEPSEAPRGETPEEGWTEGGSRAAGFPAVLGVVAIPVTPGLALPVGPRSRVPGAR